MPRHARSRTGDRAFPPEDITACEAGHENGHALTTGLQSHLSSFYLLRCVGSFQGSGVWDLLQTNVRQCDFRSKKLSTLDRSRLLSEVADCGTERDRGQVSMLHGPTTATFLSPLRIYLGLICKFSTSGTTNTCLHDTASCSYHRAQQKPQPKRKRNLIIVSAAAFMSPQDWKLRI